VLRNASDDMYIFYHLLVLMTNAGLALSKNKIPRGRYLLVDCHTLLLARPEAQGSTSGNFPR